jgi:hypothetical protein
MPVVQNLSLSLFLSLSLSWIVKNACYLDLTLTLIITLGKDLRDYQRPMTRLRVEAAKVKEVLSANAEFPVKAEQLHDETDLNTKITRVDFEAACEDMFARLTAPIDAALKMVRLLSLSLSLSVSLSLSLFLSLSIFLFQPKPYHLT